jgi:heme/copper-type cytochrome/quinol oxidase subunit 3
MVSVWLVTTGFVIATFLIMKVRGYKKMPRALRDAIAADAIFGALLLVRALL